MAMMRWDPFREMSRIQDDLNRLLDDRMTRLNLHRGVRDEMVEGWLPPVDIFEDAERMVLTMEIPGIEPKHVDVRVEQGILTVKGERHLEHEDRREHYLRMEREHGQFMRSFNLPNTVDWEHVQAEFRNGLLRITLPKREESKPRPIQVKVT